MDQITTDVRTQSWASIVTECNRCALSKQKWCRQNNVSIKSFYYWQRNLRREAAPHSGFAEEAADKATAEMIKQTLLFSASRRHLLKRDGSQKP